MTWNKKKCMWQAYLHMSTMTPQGRKQKKVSLGYHHDEEHAARIADHHRIKQVGSMPHVQSLSKTDHATRHHYLSGVAQVDALILGWVWAVLWVGPVGDLAMLRAFSIACPPSGLHPAWTHVLPASDLSGAVRPSHSTASTSNLPETCNVSCSTI